MHLRTSFVILFLILANSFSAAQETDSAAVSASPSITHYPPKIPATSRWEKIVSFPGTVLYFPFKIVFFGVEKTIATIDETYIIQRTKDWMEADNGLYKFEPTYSSRNGAGLHFHLYGLLNADSRISMTATVGTHKRQRYALQLKDVSLFSGIRLGGIAEYQFLSEEAFFGIGPDAKKSDESIYGHKAGLTALSFNYGKQTDFVLSTTVGLETNSIVDSPDADEAQITERHHPLAGLDDHVRLGHVALQLAQDTRDHLGQPHSGREAYITTAFYQDVDAHDYGFWRLNADYSQYLHLFYNRTVALRIAGQVNRAFSGQAIPFYHLSELGYRETIRGFDRGRFRDRDRLLASAEYRFPIKANEYDESGYDGLLFIDTGRVSPGIIGEFQIKKFMIGIGGGVRFYTRKGLSMKAEIAVSKEEVRTYFVLHD
ncbi:BamA/TamA family outer membrane protein [candidate division KSB1 bacterium]|nr:BamA/TamA family outer membrane protein [candidate division KSB1 bacterium]